MSLTFDMKRGDLRPDLTLYAEDGAQAADFTQVVSWRVIATRLGQPVFTDTAPTVTIDPATKWKATVVHNWASGETAVAGELKVELEAMWPGAKPQTFPPSGYIIVRIHPDLG